jgi:uncharacterized YkwD family protein
MKINKSIVTLNKKLKLSLLSAFVVIMGSSSLFASSIPICVQNKEINVGTNTPYVSNTNQTMIPIRAVGETLGLKLGWQNPNVILSGKNVVTNKPVTVKANAATRTITVNGTTFKNSIQIKNGRSYVALRVLAEVFGYKVDWKNRKVNITNPTVPATPAVPATPTKPTTPAIPATPTSPTKPTTPTVPTAPVDNSVVAYENKVLELVNVERQKAGLSPLKMDEPLRKVARLKSEDMKANGYFDHNSPTYGSPFDMMKKFGISYTMAGENIAMGQRTPEAVVTAWMNSPGHRANILKPGYTFIGVGYVASGSYWTQEFIAK